MFYRPCPGLPTPLDPPPVSPRSGGQREPLRLKSGGDHQVVFFRGEQERADPPEADAGLTHHQLRAQLFDQRLIDFAADHERGDGARHVHAVEGDRDQKVWRGERWCSTRRMWPWTTAPAGTRSSDDPGRRTGLTSFAVMASPAAAVAVSMGVSSASVTGRPSGTCRRPREPDGRPRPRDRPGRRREFPIPPDTRGNWRRW